MTTKTERFETRVSIDERRQIDRAAAMEGRTASAFVVSAALDRARQVIETHDSTLVPTDYFDRLLATIDAADAAPRLAAAAKRASRRQRILS